MNFAVSVALYACVQKEKGQPLIFPGNEVAWNSLIDHSGAENNARFQLWSSTNEKIPNEIFNIYNGDEVRYRTLWPKIEKYSLFFLKFRTKSKSSFFVFSNSDILVLHLMNKHLIQKRILKQEMLVLINYL